jgi:hypothetical protein
LRFVCEEVRGTLERWQVGRFRGREKTKGQPQKDGTEEKKGTIPSKSGQVVSCPYKMKDAADLKQPALQNREDGAEAKGARFGKRPLQK